VETVPTELERIQVEILYLQEFVSDVSIVELNRDFVCLSLYAMSVLPWQDMLYLFVDNINHYMLSMLETFPIVRVLIFPAGIILLLLE